MIAWSILIVLLVPGEPPGSATGWRHADVPTRVECVRIAQDEMRRHPPDTEVLGAWCIGDGERLFVLPGEQV